MLEQEKREQQQQNPQQQNLPPGAQPLPQPAADVNVAVDPRVVTGQIPNPNVRMPQQQPQPPRQPMPGQQQPQQPGQFNPMMRMRMGQPQWPRHPQEVTLQQRGGPQIMQQRMPVMGQQQPEPHPALRRGGLTPPAPPPQPLNTTPPPSPPYNPQTEEDRQKVFKFEQWLDQQEQNIHQQLKYYETEISKLRKQKKVSNVFSFVK